MASFGERDSAGGKKRKKEKRAFSASVHSWPWPRKRHPESQRLSEMLGPPGCLAGTLGPGPKVLFPELAVLASRHPWRPPRMFRPFRLDLLKRTILKTSFSVYRVWYVLVTSFASSKEQKSYGGTSRCRCYGLVTAYPRKKCPTCTCSHTHAHETWLLRIPAGF